MTSTAAKLQATRAAYILLAAEADVIGQSVDAAHPCPAHPCSDEVFEEWNDRYEDALEASGWYKARTARSSIARDLILAAVEHAVATCGADSETVRAIQPAVIAATAEDKRYRHSAFEKMLDLAVRLAA